jgi:hypothetical protein
MTTEYQRAGDAYLVRLKQAEADLARCLAMLDDLDLPVIASHVDLGHAQLRREIARVEQGLGHFGLDRSRGFTRPG